jgi:hypothetical protein
MYHELTALVLCLLPSQPIPNAREVLPRGIVGMACTVVAVHKDAVEVVADRDRFRGPVDQSLRLKVTPETRLEQVDLAVVDGKPKLSTRAITLQDLHQEQPISVICFGAGKEWTLLTAVASGPKLSGLDLAIDVQKLGGKLKRLPWLKGPAAFSVDLSGTPTGDADLIALGQTKGINNLDLSYTRVTDKGITSLTGTNKLSSLNLAGTKVTDAAIPDLRAMPDLRSINLAQTAVTSKGVARLVQGKSLTVCLIGLGDKARFHVYQEYIGGELSYNYLMIGDTYYGRYYVGKVSEFPDANPRDRRREATLYYHRHGPVGQVMSKLEWFPPRDILDYASDARMPESLAGLLAPTTPLPMNALAGLWSEPALGVIRLNVGTFAAYGRPFQHIDFYNSTPELKTFSLPAAGQPVYFGFIQDALKRGCCVHVFDGAERATLRKQGPKRFYGALFVDLTRNDLRDISTDLLTKEALADMIDCLSETGILCFHTSHRYHDLVPPIVDAASSLNLAWKVGKDMHYRPDAVSSHFTSEWVMVARKADYLRHLTSVNTAERKIEWSVPASTGQHLWRDGQAHDLQSLARSNKQ